MADNWAVIEQHNEEDEFVALHVVPMIVMDGEQQMSAAHTLSADCPCRPVRTINRHGAPLYNHYDPDHTGALTESEWREMIVREAGQ